MKWNNNIVWVWEENIFRLYLYWIIFDYIFGVSDENIVISDENIEISDEHIEISDENIEISDENIGVSNENIEISDENIGVSNENIGVSDEIVVGVSNERGHPIAFVWCYFLFCFVFISLCFFITNSSKCI